MLYQLSQETSLYPNLISMSDTYNFYKIYLLPLFNQYNICPSPVCQMVRHRRTQYPSPTYHNTSVFRKIRQRTLSVCVVWDSPGTAGETRNKVAFSKTVESTK